MFDEPDRYPIIVKTLDRVSTTESGESIKVGLRLFGGGQAELI